MSNTELLQKVITTSTLGSAPGENGLLSPEQSERFIDYMWDATVLGSQVRTIRMKSDTVELTKLGVGERLLRGATEGVDDGINNRPKFSKISLSTVKLRLDWELTTESLEDGVEGDGLEDHIARLMSNQAAQDLEDVAINGDTTLTGDPLLKTMDGWGKRLESGGHIVDNGGEEISRLTFHKALKKMPRKYMQKRNELKFFTGSGVIQDYLFSVQLTSADFVTPDSLAAAGINQASTPTGPAGFTTGNAFGVPVQEVPLMGETQDGTYSGATGDHGDIWLTFPKNLIWGVKREIVVYREFRPKKDAVEYTMFCRVGTQVENVDAVVVVKNVKLSI